MTPSVDDSGSNPIPQRSISADTTVKTSLAKAATGLVLIVSAAVAATAWVATLQQKLNSHIADEAVHIDPHQYKAHGDVVGKFDFDIAMAHMEGLVTAVAADVKTLQIKLDEQKRPQPRTFQR